MRHAYSSWVAAHSMRASCSSAIIAKFLPAFAGHSRAAVISFHPKLAARTLFVLGSLHELDEVLIVFIKTIIDLILSTGHSVMVLTFASQAIVFSACRATIVIELFEFKHSLASSCWAPCSWSIVLLYKFIEGEFLKFLLEISIDVTVDVANIEMLVATLHRTDHIDFVWLDLALEVGIDALGMENMAAFQDSKRISVDLRAADRALPTLWFSLLCNLLYLILLLL